MQSKGKSLESQISQAIDDKQDTTDVKLTAREQTNLENAMNVRARYDHWLAALKRRFPTMSERRLKERAAELACQNRKERRRQFKQSSPKTPQLMKVPKGKR